MIVFNQKTKKGEPKIYIGEDAHPYAKDGILLVADGLGGRGGYPHTKANKSILEKDKFYAFVFGDVFNKAVDEEFVDYVVNGFSELFEMKDYYFECESAMRTSGYFASRLVAAIALHEIKYVGIFDKEKLFDDIEKNKDRIDDVLSLYAENLANNIRKKLGYIAKKIGLEIETNVTGAYLLPTTLQIALTKERETEVQAVFLWAGDSRAYKWDECGLMQITEDHEDSETMYNLISLSRAFNIESKFERFDKPLVLFVATDGCYKCSCYSSPLEMEMTFLNAFNGSETQEEAAKNFEEDYRRIGRHDDSNSMALQLFGYKDSDGEEDYFVFKEAVKERLKYIESNIVGKLPDIFEVDYSEEARKIEEKKDDIIFADTADWINSKNIFDYIWVSMRNAQYEPFIKAKKENLDKLSALKDKVSYVKKRAMDWFENNKKLFLSPPESEEDNETLFDKLISGGLDGRYVSLDSESQSTKRSRKIAENKEEFLAIEKELNDIKEEQASLCNQQREIIVQYTMRFWRARRNEIVRKIWAERRDLLDEKEREKKEARISTLNKENEQILEKIGIRDKLYAEYNKNYKKYLKGTKL